MPVSKIDPYQMMTRKRDIKQEVKQEVKLEVKQENHNKDMLASSQNPFENIDAYVSNLCNVSDDIQIDSVESQNLIPGYQQN